MAAAHELRQLRIVHEYVMLGATLAAEPQQQPAAAAKPYNRPFCGRKRTA